MAPRIRMKKKWYQFARFIMILVILVWYLFQRHQEFRNIERNKVVEMTKHAWDGYYKYAQFSDELKPISFTGYNWTTYPLYLTAVDSLDTLYIMGLMEEYNQAKTIVLEKMNFTKVTEKVNHFEVTIRVLGGLLSAHGFDPDERYLTMAIDLADKLLMAFNTPYGIPLFQAYLNQPTHHTSAIVSLATIGTLQLEFQYLSDITSEPKYQDAALRVYEQLHVMEKPIPGLFPTNVEVSNAEFSTFKSYGLAGENDSFYEYLLKIYISTKVEKFKDWYNLAAKVVLGLI